jgi:5'-nucleotidase
MPQTLEDKLVVGISSRALFDLTDANSIFEQDGLSAYRAYQREHERDVLEPGTAYPLVKGLLAVNELAGEPLVEVIIFSRNDADSAMRVLRSVEAHGLPITRGVFRGGRDPWPLLPAMSCDVFLSAEPSQVLKAREQGVASALIMPSVRFVHDDIGEVRIAFDGDAVLFDAASQRVFDEQGIDAFHEYESSHADVPMSPGPFRPFLDGLARIQAHSIHLKRIGR